MLCRIRNDREGCFRSGSRRTHHPPAPRRHRIAQTRTRAARHAGHGLRWGLLAARHPNPIARKPAPEPGLTSTLIAGTPDPANPPLCQPSGATDSAASPRHHLARHVRRHPALWARPIAVRPSRREGVPKSLLRPPPAAARWSQRTARLPGSCIPSKPECRPYTTPGARRGHPTSRLRPRCSRNRVAARKLSPSAFRLSDRPQPFISIAGSWHPQFWDDAQMMGRTGASGLSQPRSARPHPHAPLRTPCHGEAHARRRIAKPRRKVPDLR